MLKISIIQSTSHNLGSEVTTTSHGIGALFLDSKPMSRTLLSQNTRKLKNSCLITKSVCVSTYYTIRVQICTMRITNSTGTLTHSYFMNLTHQNTKLTEHHVEMPFKSLLTETIRNQTQALR